MHLPGPFGPLLIALEFLSGAVARGPAVVLHLDRVRAGGASCSSAGPGRGLPRGLGGARWAANFLERYRSETVLLAPPQPVQRTLIALLARDSSPRGRT